jgi:hypothetical protein
MPHRPFVPMTIRLIFAALAHCNRKGEAAERCKKSSEKCVLAHHSVRPCGRWRCPHSQSKATTSCEHRSGSKSEARATTS